MAGDSVTVVTKTGFGSRLMSSIKGVFIGIVLFIASFGVLYWNEGRTGLLPIAQSTTEIKSDVLNTDTSLEGKSVSTSGKLTSDQLLGDNLYLKAGKYAAVSRTVEMYAWVEESETDTESNVGGSETSTTTYTYKKDWVQNVQSSSDFKNPTGHYNPTKGLSSKELTLDTAKVGVYNVDMTNVTLPKLSAVTLNNDTYITNVDTTLIGSEFVYLPAVKAVTLAPEPVTTTVTAVPTLDALAPTLAPTNVVVAAPPTVGSYANPAVGDLRISYKVLNLDKDVTVFGKLNGESINSFLAEDGQELYRMFSDSRDGALKQIKTEDTIKTWVIRGIGFFMMWIGLSSLFGPLTTFADILPIFGSLSKSIVSGITFVVAFLLTFFTIVISKLLHNTVALVIMAVIVVGLLAGGGYLLMKARKGKGAK